MALVATRRGLGGLEVEDHFDRTGSLGRTPDDNALPWKFLNSNADHWSISSGNATISTSRLNRNPIAYVNTLSNNGYVTLKTDTDRGGNALYFRVSDENNWWRVVLGYERDRRRTTRRIPRWNVRWSLDRSSVGTIRGRYNVSHSTTVTSNRRPSSNRTKRSSNPTGNSPNVVNFPDRGETHSDRRTRSLPYRVTNVSRDGSVIRTSTTTVTNSGFYAVQKCVNGSIETVEKDEFSDSSSFELTIKLENDKITLMKDGSEEESVTDDFLMFSTRHGIGAGEHPDHMDRENIAIDKFKFALL